MSLSMVSGAFTVLEHRCKMLLLLKKAGIYIMYLLSTLAYPFGKEMISCPGSSDCCSHH